MTSGHRLTLLRHAKSSWEDRSLRDHARPLAPRGIMNVAAIRRRFAADGVAVDLVLCSTATRTRQTWDGVSGAVAGEPRVEYLDAIYEADAPELLALLRAEGEEVRNMLLIGHSPGLGELAVNLIGAGDQHAVHRLAEKFPTGAFAALATTTSWADLGVGAGRLEQFVRPRDLPS